MPLSEIKGVDVVWIRIRFGSGSGYCSGFGSWQERGSGICSLVQFCLCWEVQSVILMDGKLKTLV